MLLKNIALTSKLCRNVCRQAVSAVPVRSMSSEPADDVIVQDVGDKGVLTLNRPKALNALNMSMVSKILPVLKAWEKEKSLVLVKGAGGKAFCAGGDVRAIAEAGLRGDKLGQEFFRIEYTVNGLIGTYAVPYIALIDGITMGGGVGLSVHGRYRVATERTLFAMPETQIGLFPDVGGSHVLPRLKGKLGWYLALTGYRLKGADVLHAGIATHYVDSSRLAALEHDLLQCCSEADVGPALAQHAASADPPFSLAPHLAQIDECFAADTVEGIVDRLQRDGSEWAQRTLGTLAAMSPTSLKVSKRLLDQGATLSLFDCLKLEYRVAHHTLNGTEFFEGVRALLIDKDKKPRWQPASLEQVTEECVQSHFQRLPDEQELKHKL